MSGRYFWKRYGPAFLYGTFGIAGAGFFFIVAGITSSPRIRDTNIPDFHLRSGVGVAGYGQIQECPVVGGASFDSDSGATHKRTRGYGESGGGEGPASKNKVTKGIR